ncbi:hypothetical protein CWE02_09690 [Brucella pituitosa]|nr:hypothetical protein CWE02_09690 [Brucella pituitosa]
MSGAVGAQGPIFGIVRIVHGASHTVAAIIRTVSLDAIATITAPGCTLNFTRHIGIIDAAANSIATRIAIITNASCQKQKRCETRGYRSEFHNVLP